MNAETKDKPVTLICMLAAVCAVAGLALGLVSMGTSGAITAGKENAERAALLAVHPRGKYFELVETKHEAHGKPFTYYKVFNKPLDDTTKKWIGYVYEGRAKGYSSTLVVMVGLKKGGMKITGIRITEQQETPGLGANCTALESDKYIWEIFSKSEDGGTAEPWFQAQFRGRMLRDMAWDGKSYQGVRGLSGATITTNAVVRAIFDGADDLARTTGYGPVDTVTGASTRPHKPHKPKKPEAVPDQKPLEDKAQ